MASLILLACTIGQVQEPVKSPADGPAAAKTGTLRHWQTLVGQWRGVGQVRRGSREGAWRVDGQWQWNFDQGESLNYVAPDDKYLKQARLSATGEQLRLAVGETEFAQVS